MSMVRTPAALALLLASMSAPGLLYAAPAAAATTSPTFVRAAHQQLGNNHVAADFDGDGRPDLAGQGVQAAAVLLNRGDGTFGAWVDYPVADWTQDLAAGDFNADGRSDLVATINNPQTSLSLLLGNGNGTFQPPREIDIGSPATRIAVGDFDRDGVKDLSIVTSRARLLLLEGLGDGTFAQQPALQLTDPSLFMEATDVDVADLTGDAIQDIVVAVALNGSKTAISDGNGDGTFRAPLLLTEPNLNVPHYQAVADYNLDNFPDLAISLANGNSGPMQD